jgi:hypothetical protein
MRFNSQELGVKLIGSKRGGCSGGDDSVVNPAVCTICSNCTNETHQNKRPPEGNGDKDCTEHTRGPGKKKRGSHAAGLELLRVQLRESLGSAAR